MRCVMLIIIEAWIWHKTREQWRFADSALENLRAPVAGFAFLSSLSAIPFSTRQKRWQKQPRLGAQMRQEDYPPGTIVFAKLRGYPWWPARVSYPHPPEQPCSSFRLWYLSTVVNLAADDTRIRVVCFPAFYLLVYSHRLVLKVEDDKDIPARILEQRNNKTRGPQWTVYFFGSKD